MNNDVAVVYVFKSEAAIAHDREVVQVKIEAAPSFSVLEYVDHIKTVGYVNNYMYFNFDQLLEDLPKAMKAYSNDIVAKAMLSHCYGEQLAKNFRNWIREQMDPSLEYACGGASIGVDEEGLAPC